MGCGPTAGSPWKHSGPAHSRGCRANPNPLGYNPPRAAAAFPLAPPRAAHHTTPTRRRRGEERRGGASRRWRKKMVSLKLQKRLAASVLKCGKGKVWLDPNEVNLNLIWTFQLKIINLFASNLYFEPRHGRYGRGLTRYLFCRPMSAAGHTCDPYPKFLYPKISHWIFRYMYGVLNEVYL